MSLVSGWTKIATSGPTADGRNIPAEWLSDMAETYSMDEYTALIWWEHDRNYGDDGKVYALKTDTDKKGRLCLFAKLQPSSYLQQSSKRRTLFASIEPSNKNFAGSGKRYLMGLGYTDEPGSLGTDQLLFSAKGDQFKNHEDKPTAWSPLVLSEPDADNDDDTEAVNWFKKKFPNLFNNQSHAPGDDESGEDEMNKEQFEQFMTQQQTNHAELLETFTTVKSSTAVTDDDKGAGKNESIEQRFSKLEAEQKALKAENTKFKKKNEKLKNKFKALKNKAIDSTDADDADAVKADDLP